MLSFQDHVVIDLQRKTTKVILCEKRHNLSSVEMCLLKKYNNLGLLQGMLKV